MWQRRISQSYYAQSRFTELYNIEETDVTLKDIIILD